MAKAKWWFHPTPTNHTLHYESSRIKNTKTISTKPSTTIYVPTAYKNINISWHIAAYNITNITKPQNAHIVPQPQPAKPFFYRFAPRCRPDIRIYTSLCVISYMIYA